MIKVLPSISESNPMETSKKSRQASSRGRFLSARVADAFLDWIIFPALLFIQFAATMYCQAQRGVLELAWADVMILVSIFCIVAGIYRRVLRNHPSESLLLLLLPEIFTNLLLCAVMFGDVTGALILLRVLTAILVLVGGMTAAHIALSASSSVIVNPEDYRRLPGSESDEESQNDGEVHVMLM